MFPSRSTVNHTFYGIPSVVFLMRWQEEEAVGMTRGRDKEIKEAKASKDES